jgi:hypothetical protein
VAPHGARRIPRRHGHGGALVLRQRDVLHRPNNELGGPNDTACHLDIPMRGCSLFLDDEPMVLDGDIAVKEMKYNFG